MSNEVVTPSEAEHATPVNETPPKFELTPLTSIRFFAALHILLFHIYEVHRMMKEQEGGFTLKLFDRLPAAVLNWLRHGYFSTSLFFLISGFILAFLYIRPDGTMSVSHRSFWIARTSRVYPLHLLILLLALPLMVIGAVMTPDFDFGMVVIGGLLSATLTQAWFPSYALSGNFPTWALSAVAFFYLAFPLLTWFLRKCPRVCQWILLLLMPGISLIPTFVFLWYHPEGGQPMSFWSEFVMRTPLFWIPHFLMGMLLSRIFDINRYHTDWQASSRPWVSWGDFTFLAVMGIAVSDVSIPNFILRHGMLAPLYLVTIYDLALGRGLLAHLLCIPSLKRLGDASFAIFMLQMPVGMIVGGLCYTLSLPSAFTVSVMVLAIVGVSLLSTRYFEKPVSNYLRKRFAA